jgi:hypothetical protein
MQKAIVNLGRLVGVVGILVCVVAAVLRLLGNYSVVGLGTGTVLQTGTSAVVIGCFLLLFDRAENR